MSLGIFANAAHRLRHEDGGVDGLTSFLAKAGGVMTGFLTLVGDPTSPLHAATKGYVDAHSGGGGSLSPLAGHLAADITGLAAGSTTTAFSTSTLGVGVWAVDMTALVGGATSQNSEMQAVVASGVATFEGQYADQLLLTTGNVQRQSGKLRFLLTVTSDCVLQCKVHLVASGNIYAATVTNGYAGATGWTALKVG